MKKDKKWSKVLLAGMAALVLAFGLVLTGCPTEVDETPPPFAWPAEVAGTYWVSGEGLSARIVKFNADNTFFDNDMNGGKIDNIYTVENFWVSNTDPNEPWYHFDAKPVDANIWSRKCTYYFDSDGKLQLTNEVFTSDFKVYTKENR